jgi:hypothetical protein
MLTLSLIFTLGGEAPSLFGNNIYIVKTDAVEFLKPGTAIFTSKVPFDEIIQGDIVVYRNPENDLIGMAEIETAAQNNNVFTYDAISERGTEIILIQSQIVGKATQYSDFFGAIIGFAKSGAGVMVIAVIPCMIILIYEGSKAIFAAKKKQGEIKPVKKQDEIPTYVPRQKMSGRASAVKEYAKDEISEEDDYDRMLAEIEDGFDGEKEDDFPLFKPPASKAVAIGKPAPKAAPRTAPLSQKRLNQAIAEVNARKIPENTGRITDQFPFDTDETPIISPTGSDNSATYEVGSLREIKTSTAPAPENVKRYTPKKNAAGNGQRVSNATSTPSLDRLLREDDPEAENARYNIEDILFSIDKKR